MQDVYKRQVFYGRYASHKAGKSLAEPSESDLCFDACVKTNKDLLLTKVTKCCAQGESKRRLATFAFTGTAAINAEHLEHY